jgi:hypothetical protein
MKQTNVLTCVRASAFALSLMVLPIVTPLSAQTTTPDLTTPRGESRVETRVERDYTGLWGLLGLLGLAGLMRSRRPDTVRTSAATDTGTRERSRT